MLNVLVFAAITKAVEMKFAEILVQAPKAQVRVDVADTFARREYGLMFRKTLDPHTGMVFVFSSDDQVGFWMKNTLVPLDMVFVGADMRVRTVAAHVPPSAPTDSDDAIAKRYGRAKFVFELPAGEAASDGFAPGAFVDGLQSLKSKE